jgi:hypothetical protein
LEKIVEKYRRKKYRDSYIMRDGKEAIFKNTSCPVLPDILNVGIDKRDNKSLSFTI